MSRAVSCGGWLELPSTERLVRRAFAARRVNTVALSTRLHRKARQYSARSTEAHGKARRYSGSIDEPSPQGASGHVVPNTHVDDSCDMLDLDTNRRPSLLGESVLLNRQGNTRVIVTHNFRSPRGDFSTSSSVFGWLRTRFHTTPTGTRICAECAPSCRSTKAQVSS